MTDPVVVGAVLYDPKVSVIWNIIRDFFESRDCPVDVRFYADYGRQAEALAAGGIHVAWNSPLAWLDAQRRSGGACRAIAMRDTDRDRVSHFVASREGGIRTLRDLRGKTLATGAKDSPQATLIPLGTLQAEGLEPGRDFAVKRFDLMVGKHGDHIGGELEAFRELERGGAAASTMLDLNWEGWCKEGIVDPARYAVVASTPRFDHCVFTVQESFPRETEERWLRALFSMSYEDPSHREMMDLEGLKAWMPGRVTGFGPLSEAVRRQRFFEDPAP